MLPKKEHQQFYMKKQCKNCKKFKNLNEFHKGDGARNKLLEKGDTFHIPPGRAHQILAIEDTELFEFSTFHEDSDSYRLIKGD